MRYIISSILASLPLQAMADVPLVITDIPPVHGLVAQVLGDLGTPVLLLEKGADEHDFQLRPSQMQAIAKARATPQATNIPGPTPMPGWTRRMRSIGWT
jgi:zinc transport system substrate-binding protein